MLYLNIVLPKWWSELYTHLLPCDLLSSVCLVHASRAAPPIDGLLFLQCRAGDSRLRAGGVLVSSQAGCLCFWSIAAQAHTCGEPGEMVG